jgi:SAM-dependent methyltransferase
MNFDVSKNIPIWREQVAAPQTVENIPVYAPHIDNQDEDYDPDFYEFLATVEKGHFWFENRNRLIASAIGGFFPSAQEFLEVGCGTGFVLDGLTHCLPELTVSGTDMHLKGLRILRDRVPDAHLFQSDARILPFTEAFDVIGLFDVLEHVQEDGEVLVSIWRALKPGGGIVLTVPQHQWLWSTIDEISGHKRRYEQGELHTKLELAGFRVCDSLSFMTFPVPLLWLNRFFGNSKAPERLFRDQFLISPLVNALLSFALRIERYLIKVGIRFPVGSSRLVIARKPSRALPDRD